MPGTGPSLPQRPGGGYGDSTQKRKKSGRVGPVSRSVRQRTRGGSARRGAAGGDAAHPPSAVSRRSEARSRVRRAMPARVPRRAGPGARSPEHAASQPAAPVHHGPRDDACALRQHAEATVPGSAPPAPPGASSARPRTGFQQAAGQLRRPLKRVQMRGGARRPHARRTLRTLSVRPRAPTKQMGPFQRPASRPGRAPCA